MDASEILEALYAGGVQDWDGYSIAMSTLDDSSSDEDILEALDNTGVDNWSGYDAAMSELCD